MLGAFSDFGGDFSCGILSGGRTLPWWWWFYFISFFLKSKIAPFIFDERTISCDQLLRPSGLQPARLLCSQDFLGKNPGMSCHFLPQGILPTQGSNPSLLHQQWILYQLNRQGSLRKPQFTWLSKLHTLEQTSYCPKRTFSLPATISGQPASHPEFLACLSISGLR